MKFKLYSFIITVCILLSSCSSHKTSEKFNLPSWVDPKMNEWLTKSVPNFLRKGFIKGWVAVKWSPNLLAKIGTVNGWVAVKWSPNLLAKIGTVNGWVAVKWSPNLLAKIGTVNDTHTNIIGKTEADKLNAYFKNTHSQGPSEKLGAYYDSGIFVHEQDGYDKPNTLIDPKLDYIATSYIRSRYF